MARQRCRRGPGASSAIRSRQRVEINCTMKLRLRLSFPTLAGIALVAAGGAFLFSGCTPANQAEPSFPPPTMESETPEAVSIPKIDPMNPEPIRFTAEQLEALKNIPMPESLAQYDAMTVEEFAEVPISERLTYLSYINRDSDYLKSAFASGSGDNRYLLGTDVSVTSSPEEVIVSGNDNLLFGFTLHFASEVYDNDEYQKSLLGAFVNNDDPNYLDWSNNIAQGSGLPARTLGEQGSLQIPNFVAEGESYTLDLGDGVERTVRSITTEFGGVQYTSDYVLVEYTAYDGEQKASYVRLN